MSDEIEFGEYRETVSGPREAANDNIDSESENSLPQEIRTTRSTDNRLRVMENRLEYMMQSVFGTMWAAAAYCTIFLLIGFCMLFYEILSRRVGSEEVITGFAYAGFMLAVIVFIAGMAGCVAVLVVNLINWSLGFIFTIRESIVVGGGVVGFWIMAVPFLFISSGDFKNDWLWILLWLHVCPVLGCIFGSVGAGLWEAKRIRKRYHTFFDDRPVFQFGMRHMLIITAWAAVVLGFSQGTKLMTIPILVMIWLFWQSVIVFLYARLQSRARKATNVAIQWQSNVKETRPALELIPETGLAANDRN